MTDVTVPDVTDGLWVRGNATAEELAVVVALMSQRDRDPGTDRYTDWRQARLAALRQRPRG